MEKTLLTRAQDLAVFSARDFLDLGSRAAVDQALSRLQRCGTLRKLIRGLYDLPRRHRIWGPLPVAPEAVAEALARRDGLRLRPADSPGERLRIYLTDGRPRRIRVGKWEIVFKHASPRTLARPC